MASISEALALASAGFRVFPLRGKFPLGKWQQQASSDASKVLVEFAPHVDADIGIATGPDFFVVDVDGDEGRASLAALPALPPTYTVQTSRGHHYYYKVPSGAICPRNSQSRVGNKIDIRGDGGYVVAAGSVNTETGHVYDGNGAELVDGPQWLLDLAAPREVVRAAVNAPHIVALTGHDKIERRAQAYLDKIDGAVSGQGGHDATYKAALALVRGFALPESTALAMMQSYNARCTPPWSEKELARKVSQACKSDRTGLGYLLTETRRTFDADESSAADAMIAALAGDVPALRVVDDENAQDEAEAIERAQEAEAQARITTARERKEETARASLDLAARVRSLGGLCETFTGWVLESSIYPQPEIAIGALLSLGSALFSRRVLTSGRVGLNTYVLAIGESGSGKGRPQACLSDALAGWSHVKGPGVFSSTKSTIKRIADAANVNCGGIVCIQDEYGVKFSGWVNAKMGHQAEIRSLLLEMSTKWGGVYSTATSVMDGGNDLTITAPAISIFGSTTPSTIEAAFRGNSVLDGLAGRHLVFRCLPRLPERNRSHAARDAVPQSVSDAVARVRDEHAHWRAGLPKQNGTEILMHIPQIVGRTAEAQALFDALSDRIDHERRESNNTAAATLDARRAERVECVEALLACLAGVSAYVDVNADHHRLACEIVDMSMRHLARGAADADMRSSEFGELMARVSAIIQDVPQGITRRNLMRRAQWLDTRTLGNIIDALRESETITETREKSANGRVRVGYVWQG
jgi:hypothetical protein